jgi:hypothetical protein
MVTNQIVGNSRIIVTIKNEIVYPKESKIVTNHGRPILNNSDICQIMVEAASQENEYRCM